MEKQCNECEKAVTFEPDDDKIECPECGHVILIH